MSNLDKICSTCKERLPKEKFRRINRNNWSGFYPKCKNCESILMRSRYEKNPIPQMLSNAKIRAKKIARSQSSRPVGERTSGYQ